MNRRLFCRTFTRLVHSSMKQHTILLNDSEQKIRNLLVGYCDYYRNQGGKPLTLRITGGWVRDKLLCNESQDIDIAIDHLLGVDFVNGLQNYLIEQDPEMSMRHVHTIKMNPLKSKHLETCTTKLYDIDLDFVNLRSEEYTEESRVPVIEFGTPKEDAMRRDATLNALFYNLNEQKIEDFTGKGLQDLQDGVLRTPLSPVKTFLDDPLRILRLIRFACKFDFKIEKKTLEAMMELHNQKALSTKISKERIEIELRKALVSKNPSYGLRLIYHCNLVKSIFYVDGLGFDETAMKHSVKRIPHHLLAASAIYPYFEQQIHKSTIHMLRALEIFDDDSKFNFWLSMILHPYSTVPRVKNKDVYDQFLRVGLKCKKSDINKISAINLVSRTTIDQFLEAPQSVKRSDLGLYLREFPDFASLNLLVQCFIDCIHNVHVDGSLLLPPPPSPTTADLSLRNKKLINETIAKYESLFSHINQLGLEDVHIMKPLLEGRTIAKELEKKPGPWMKPVTDEVLKWQLDNPSGSAEECMMYIKSKVTL
ncbi:hypothetical protein LELG_05760 [Lodderomyces elongisporus NRRL YB-4239]|uniref:CCA tRNA nucleotidyltransferase, mitochondrial n=1 Tax=Lodderomyces elongisporus (strain ATCC 11503 / CBS 2605 / JCM 1781 / NBRC 1676 / NRRL YB-4239) TaxID=379508 RepID=A5H2P5_LODEL|nr:hypothetical protein LELG_05760 [Lodderomyces elongisporus NRRL YB-4239]